MKNFSFNRIGKLTPGLAISDLCNQAQLELLCQSKIRGKADTKSKPGEYLSKQPEEIREVLKNLKSEDMFNLRLSDWEIVGIDFHERG